MYIQVRRTTAPYRGTSWRPIRTDLYQVEQQEIIRAEYDYDGEHRLKRVTRNRKTQLSDLDRLLAGKEADFARAKIESPYRKDEFVKGFVYVKALDAFLHESVVEAYRDRVDQIAPGSVIGKNVRIDPGATIGPFTELEAGVQLFAGTRIGERSVVRKGSIIGEGTQIGAGSYIGQFAFFGYGVEVGSMSRCMRNTTIQRMASLGRQSVVGSDTTISQDCWFDDSVRVGNDCFAQPNTWIGEMSRVGNQVWFGDNVKIGAETRIGDFVIVESDVMLHAESVVPPNSYVAQSNIFAPRNR